MVYCYERTVLLQCIVVPSPILIFSFFRIKSFVSSTRFFIAQNMKTVINSVLRVKIVGKERTVHRVIKLDKFRRGNSHY